MRVLLATVLTLAFTLALSTVVPAAALGQSPTTAAEAMAYYESDVDDWLDGPVEYLILDEERDAWKELRTSDQRAAFITRFWERRDADLRQPGQPVQGRILRARRLRQPQVPGHAVPRLEVRPWPHRCER